MNGKRVALSLLLILLPGLAAAGDWRVHLAVCNQDPDCAREQAAAQGLWDSQEWTPELKESCRVQHIQMYAKDYRAALACVTDLEEKRRESQADQADIDNNRDDYGNDRVRDGVIIVRPRPRPRPSPR